MTTTGNGSCSAVADQMILSFTNPPVCDAGTDMFTCGSAPVGLGAGFSYASGVIWSTSGDGFFDDNTSANPDYTPGPGDNLAGSVDLFVTTTGGGCTPEGKDTLVLVIEPPVSISVQPVDTAICLGNNAGFSVSATGTGLSYQWYVSTDGGTIFNPVSDGPVYSGATTSNLITTAPDMTYDGYLYQVTVTSSCGSSVNSFSVILNVYSTILISAGADTTICSGSSVQLSASGDVGVTGGIWTSSGDGTFDYDTIPNPTYTPGSNDITNGSVTITISVTGPCGAASDDMIITIANPTALVTAGGATTFCSGGSVDLTEISGTGTTYQWQESGVDVTGETSSTYMATASGNYTVIVANGTCSDTSTAIIVTVDPVPTAAASAGGATSFCSGGSVILTETSGTGTTYRWQESGMDITGEISSAYVATASGSYTVIISNGTCSDTSATIAVTVDPVPVVSVTAGGSTTFCTGGSVDLTEISGTGTTYQWQESGVDIVGEISSTYTATASGNYTVIIANGTCSDTSAIITITVDSQPTIANAGPDQNICSNSSTFAGNSPSVGLGTWSLVSGAGSIANSPDPASPVSALGTGVNQFQWTIINGSCPPSFDQVSINVGSAPNSGLVVTPLEDTLCLGADALLTLQSAQNGITYQAYVGGTAVGLPGLGTGIDLVLTIPNSAFAAGTNSVSIEAQSACPGATLAAAPIIHKSTIAAPLVSSTGGSLLCNNTSIVLNAPAGYPSYQWFLNNAMIVGETTLSLNAVVTGNYEVEVSDNLCKIKSSPFAISSAATPPVIVAGISDAFSTELDVPSGAPYYQWYTGGKAIYGANSNVLTTYFNAYYYVATNFNNCRVVSDSFNISNPSYLPLAKMSFFSNDSMVFIDPPAAVNMTVYPNPTEDAFQVNYQPTGKDKVVIELFDSMGNRIVFRTIESSYMISEEFTNLNLRSGIYMISITEGEKRVISNVQIN